MGLGPFEYEYAGCYLRDCPEDWPVSQGWDHESYLRSGGMDLTGLCRDKYDSLLERLEWVDTGTYWDEFLHLCGKWHDSGTVVEEFARHFEDGVYETCRLMAAYGWRLGPPGDTGHADGDRFSDECLPGRGLGGFLRDWSRAGL